MTKIIEVARRGKAATALSELREKLVSRGATLEEMLQELRRLRETKNVAPMCS